MRGGGAPKIIASVATVLAITLGTGCGVGVADEAPVPVPTFPAPETSAEAAAPAANEGLPAECERVLPVADLEALLGLPLASTAVRTVIDVPAPSVRRTEKISCSYTARSSLTGHDRNALLFDLDVSRYAATEAAASHWQLNVDVQDGALREADLGAASAVLVEAGDTALLIAHETEMLTLVLPEEVRVGERTAGDTLVDLALRVLPRVTTSAQPAVSADAAR